MRILTILCHEIASDWKLIKSGVPKNQNIKGNLKQYVIQNLHNAFVPERKKKKTNLLNVSKFASGRWI